MNNCCIKCNSCSYDSQYFGTVLYSTLWYSILQHSTVKYSALTVCFWALNSKVVIVIVIVVVVCHVFYFPIIRDIIDLT